MTNNTFLGTFVLNYTQLISPLKTSLSSTAEFRKLFLDLGWDIPNPPIAAAQQVVNSIEILIDDFDALSENPSEEDMANLLSDILDVYLSLKSFANQVANTTIGISPNQSVFISEFPEDLFNYLIDNYLNSNFGTIFNFLKLFGIIEHKYIDKSPPRPEYIKVIINYQTFTQLISNPLLLIKSSLKWNNSDFDIDDIFEQFSEYLSSLKIGAVIGEMDGANNRVLYNHGFSIEDLITYPLYVYLLDVLVGVNYEHLGIKILGALGSQPNDTGLILQFDIPSNIGLTEDITDSLSLKLNLSTAIGESFAFLIKPVGIEFKYLTTDIIPRSNLELRLINSPEKPTIIFGQPAGTRLELQKWEITLQAIYYTDLEFGINIDLSGLHLILTPENSDNFISSIFENLPKDINFPITIEWSNVNGISFKGSGSFEYKVNTHFKIGPIEFNNVTVALTAPKGQNDVKVAVGTDIKGSLGPVSFTVNNIGLSLVLGLIEGNAGPFDIQIGFKSPTGVGLAIDAPPVSGGGFLNYDEATYTYTGGLELNFSKISFSAIGIISTKLPGGEDGYSLLIIITAEFGPLPIGMGFTLNGLGGLMGLNRTMNPEFLREGIKNNTLDSILFPKDIVKNANTIISNIGQAFPILKDQFVIGPMAKIGWGTPTLITIELGIMIELPNPVRLAILGVLKAILPTESKPVLQLQVNFLGIIDFDNKYISFDASLYDSKILTFGLFGDMALRLYWGDEPNFLLSVGGFHPKFTPPPLDLPTMRRLTIILANEDDLKISVETYFAVTSNSVQFGAKVAAMAKAWKIQAIGALWFDILFQFSPFHFIADMGAMFAIKMGSKTILSLFIDLSLEGPHPWKAQGRGSFKILFVKVSVSFNKTFGRADVATIPPVAIDDKFTDAVKSKDNWEAILADRNNQQVACREIAGSQQGLLIVDPGGSLRFSQNLVPLDTKIEKFGNSAISDYNKYSIAAANHGFTLSPAQDYFARNSFFYLSDDDKLSRPSYELFNSGIIAGATAIVSRFAVHRLCEYEQITLDSGYRELKPVWAMLESVFEVHVFENYVSRAQIAQFDKIPTEKGWPGTVQLSHDDDDFILVNRNNLEQAIPQSFSSSVEAERVLQENRNTQPGVASEWIVANRFELEL